MTTTSHIRRSTHHTGTATARDLKTVFGVAREARRNRKAVRAMHAQIERELASYTTPNEIAELDAMIERSDVQIDDEGLNVIERIIRARSV